MERKSILEAIAKRAKERGVKGFIFPNSDPHFGEYRQEHYNVVEWISHFDGSAATLVVTVKGAALWTDSRYFIQAQEQLEGSTIELMRLKVEGTPTIAEWLTQQLEEGDSIGIDPLLFSRADYLSLTKELSPLKLKLCEEPLEGVWSERPPLYSSQAITLPITITGEKSEQKLKMVKERLAIEGRYLYLLSTGDAIAWICNIRGADIPYNPLLYSYLLIGSEGDHLFIASESLSSEVRDSLESNGIELHPYNQFNHYLSTLEREILRVAPLNKISAKSYNLFTKGDAPFMADPHFGGVVDQLKAIKNSVEIEGFRRAMMADGIAWVRWWSWLEETLERGEEPTEMEIVNKIIEVRSLDNHYRGESFAPIVAYGANGALPHYSPSNKREVKVKREGLLLVDCGAHYTFGTTDSTRTIAVGEPTNEQKRDYTAVLKGMIALSRAKFPKGSRGASLDILARAPIYNLAKQFLHGTGHGVGHYLCVHEGPQSIRVEENPTAIEPGMVISNEPAIYNEGQYGIRIENLLLSREWKENQFGEFYQFETLTYIPIDSRAIEFSQLKRDEIEWLIGYHKELYNLLSPHLNESEKSWLREKCSY